MQEVSDASAQDTTVKRTTVAAPNPCPKRGADIEASLHIALERVARGGEEKLRLCRPAACPSCRGSGGQDGAVRRPCEVCQGSGHITHSLRGEGQPVPIQRITPCTACYGRGNLIDHPCTACRGTGTIAREETVAVTIPRGVADDTVLRLAGQGAPSPDPAGSAGDLLVLVQTQRDPRFERDGANLLFRETIDLTDAVLGTTRAVPTLDEAATSVQIPPGTQAGTVLRLPGKGLPGIDGERRGELLVHIRVQVPRTLSPEERALYERLRVLASRPTSDGDDSAAHSEGCSLPGG